MSAPQTSTPAPPAPPRRWWWYGLFPALAIVLTIAHWYVVTADDVPLGKLSGWIWIGFPKPKGAAWLLVLLAGVPLLTTWAVVRVPGRWGAKVAVLFVLGVGLQHGFSWLEGRGIAALREHIVSGPHSEFPAIAVRQSDILALVCHYEQRVRTGELGRFARSKPPGQLLLYVFTDRLARVVLPRASEAERLAHLQTLATYLWPVLSYVVLVPLFLTVRSLFDAERAVVACVLYLFVPSVNLIVLHTDQVFYPTFFMVCLSVAYAAAVRRSLARAVLAGVVIYLAVFCTFALVLVLPFVVAESLLVAFRQASGRWNLGAAARNVLGVLAGAAATDVVFRLVFNYDIVVRYRAAVAHHVAWYGWDGQPSTVAYYALLVSIEMLVWTGVPLVALAAVGEAISLPQIGRRRFTAAACVSWSFLVVLGILLLFGKTKAEAPRLWLFLVPVICTLAANAFVGRYANLKRWALPAVVLLQGVTVYIIKVYQDFW